MMARRNPVCLISTIPALGTSADGSAHPCAQWRDELMLTFYIDVPRSLSHNMLLLGTGASMYFQPAATTNTPIFFTNTTASPRGRLKKFHEMNILNQVRTYQP